MARRILVIGHSHVGSLPGAIWNDEHRWFNLKFPAEEVQFDFCIKGGAKTHEILSGSNSVEGSFADTITNRLSTFNPHAIWLWIGDNDIKDGCSESSYELALRIFNTAATLVHRASASASFISIIQLLPRYEGARGDIVSYNRRAEEVNKYVLAFCKDAGPYIHFALHRFLFQGYSRLSYRLGANRFDRFGVHLNRFGIDKLCYRLRPAVQLALDFLRRPSGAPAPVSTRRRFRRRRRHHVSAQ